MSEKKRVFTVLVIDGGGVRGIIPARILEEIEKRTGKPIAELFDMVGGVSTGAIVAAALTLPDDKDPTKPRYTAEGLKDFYYKQSPKIFPELKFKSLRQISSSAAYDPRPLEETLYTYFGDARVRDSLTHLMIPAVDIKNFRPVWISSFKGQKDLTPENWSSMLMRDAIRGATTAPTYFPAKYVTTAPDDSMPGVQHRHTLIDGGFFAGNAMRRMLTQARRLAPPDAEIVVVHVGTGLIGNSLSPDEWNSLGPLGMLSKARGSILMSLASNISLLDTADDLKDELGDHFIALNGYIDYEDKVAHPSPDMDRATPANMKLLEAFADQIVSDSADDFNRLCRMLEERLFAEQDHCQSAEALRVLAARMDDIHTVKSLTRFYRQALKGINDLGTPPQNEDAADIQRLARLLNDKHRAELDKIYNLLQDKLENQNKIANAARETGDNIGKMFKKLTGRFNGEAGKDAPPAPPANDDAPPPAGLDATPKKQNWWKW